MMVEAAARVIFGWGLFTQLPSNGIRVSGFKVSAH